VVWMLMVVSFRVAVDEGSIAATRCMMFHRILK
jgi:hypothetical protein